MDEFQIIRQLFDRPLTDKNVRVGIGDDGAILVPEPGRNLVTVVDTLLEDVHFPQGMVARDAGYRALAVNLSDIAAMGARPRWMTLALSLDSDDEEWLRGFAEGLFDAANEHCVSLVGGDTTRGSQKVISIQLLGDIEPGKELRRSGASIGDGLFVSGTIGDAAAGLTLMDDDHNASDEKRYLRQRFSRPSARVTLGQALIGTASAAIDLSDGLYADIQKLLEASEVGGRIELESIPVSVELRSIGLDDDAILNFALAGGDDYELCFTVSPENEGRALALSEEAGVVVTRIGEVREGDGLTCVRGGSAIDYADHGYRHF